MSISKIKNRLTERSASMARYSRRIKLSLNRRVPTEVEVASAVVAVEVAVEEGASEEIIVSFAVIA